MTSLPHMIGIAAVAALFTATLFVHAGAGTASAVVVASSLAIDADTSDGCGTIQSTAAITQGTATSVGICLINAASAPVDGFISAASLYVTYTGPLTASDVAGNGTTDLNSNPDWNQAVGGSWDCNSLDLPASAPTAAASPATITCDSVGLADVPVSGNVLLATLNFNAAGSLGTSTLAFTGTDLFTGVAGVANPVCGQGFTCDGASITVQAAALDTDGDSMPDWYEFLHPCLDANVADANSDADADGLSNIQEYQLGSDPCNADTDGDGMPDGYEHAHGCLSLLQDDALADPDADGLGNLREYQLGTDPCNSDTDGDGYSDLEEVALGKNPLVYCDIMRADVDKDGQVSILDLSQVAHWFGQQVPPVPAAMDQDGDHAITILDLSRMARQFLRPITDCP